MDIFIGALGAYLYRLRGGLKEGIVNRQLTRFLVLLPFLISFGLILYLNDSRFTVGDTIALLALTGATYFGIVTGHGSYMDLGRSKLSDDERSKPIVDLFVKKEGYFRDFVGLALTGLWITLPISILYITQGAYFSALLPIVGGLMKAPSYDLGYRFANDDRLPFRMQGGTEIGEAFTGFFIFGTSFYGVLSLLIYGTMI